MSIENKIHQHLIEQITKHDYSFMYSEDNDVWAKGKHEIEEIKNTLGILVGMGRRDPQELLDECLSEFPNEGDYHTLARNEITKWFNEYLDLGPEYDSAGFTEEDRIVNGQYMNRENK